MSKGNSDLSRPVLLGSGGFLGKYLRETFSDSLPISRQTLNLEAKGAGEKLGELLGENDTIFFLASIAPDKGRDTETFLKNCQMGSEVVKAMERKKPGRMIYISSDAVFCENLPPLAENDLPCPSSLYGIMHLAREKMLVEACIAMGVPLLIVRLCAVYGPGDTHNAYGPNRFVRSALENGIIDLFGSGEERRPHLWISDAIRALKGFFRMGADGIIHLVPPSSVTFAEIACELQKLISGTQIRHLPRTNPITHKDFSASADSRWLSKFDFTDLRSGLLEFSGKMR